LPSECQALHDFLFVSSSRDAVLLVTIMKRGVLDSGIAFLPKPFTGSSLLARVRTVLDAAERSRDERPGVGCSPVILRTHRPECQVLAARAIAQVEPVPAPARSKRIAL
jgi:DNA-binding response OmpR family regulator